MILNFENREQIMENLDQIKNHFKTTKSPVMIGGGSLAYTLLGIRLDELDQSKIQFLIMDPHYIGQDNLSQVTDKKSKAIYWTDQNIFKPKSFYNFLLPQ